MWLRFFAIAIEKDVLTYRTLFTGNRSIHVSEIESARIETDFGRKFGAPQQLVIYPAREAASKPIRINTKVFSRDDLRVVFDWLGTKLLGKRRVGIVRKIEI